MHTSWFWCEPPSTVYGWQRSCWPVTPTSLLARQWESMAGSCKFRVRACTRVRLGKRAYSMWEGGICWLCWNSKTIVRYIIWADASKFVCIWGEWFLIIPSYHSIKPIFLDDSVDSQVEFNYEFINFKTLALVPNTSMQFDCKNTSLVGKQMQENQSRTGKNLIWGP